VKARAAVAISIQGPSQPQFLILASRRAAGWRLLDDGDGNNDGNRIKFVAPHSFSIWTTYNVTPEVNIGGGVNYTGTRYVNDANTQKFKPYARVDATIGYKASENLDLRVNVQNLTDKLYYDASHVGIFANVAPGRSALLTANLRY